MSHISVQDILNLLSSWAPLDTAASWDNCGLQIGDNSASVNSVYVSLDVDLTTLMALQAQHHDLVITHHPLFFKPLTQLLYGSDIGRIIQQFSKHQQHLISMHTNLDAAPGGVADCLLAAYGLDPAQAHPLGEGGYGRWIELEAPVSTQDLIGKHPHKHCGHALPETVQRIAVCGGSGGSLIHDVSALDIPLFITGEMNYHSELLCEFESVSAILLGHRESERFVCAAIEERLKQHFPSLAVTCDPRAQH